MLSKAARKALIGWESHHSRIIKAPFKTKMEGITMNVIQSNAPTNDSSDDDKDPFYGASVDHGEVLRKGSNHPDGRSKRRSYEWKTPDMKIS
ncbi:unnamed protein product [Schistosoma margrebowiei]|uniref:Uncharacterized protein n=1 Tax=Schistosoma margrebowiei TaxID=48269 RepID=A0A183N1S5_9TREM|nr:unnamed protein product [Schistosoma margrebowiei]